MGLCAYKLDRDIYEVDVVIYIHLFVSTFLFKGFALNFGAFSSSSCSSSAVVFALVGRALSIVWSTGLFGAVR